MGPHIILPLAEPNDTTQHIPGVNAHTHADVHSCGLTNLPGTEKSVTHCCFRVTLEVSGMAGHQGGRQSFPLREAKCPVPGSVQAHIHLKGISAYADGPHSVLGAPCLAALVGSEEAARV